MYGHGANLTFPSAQMYSRASDGVVCMMRNFDLQNKVRQESSKHTRRQDKYIKPVVEILQEMCALKEIPGRTHSGIGTVPKDPVSALDFNDLNAWISKLKRKCRGRCWSLVNTCSLCLGFLGFVFMMCNIITRNNYALVEIPTVNPPTPRHFLDIYFFVKI